MRHLVIIFACLLLSITICTAQKSLTFSPAKPKAGEKITITYNPSATPLFGEANFDTYAYLLEGKLPQVKEVPMIKKGNIYEGSFTTNDTTLAVFISLVKDEKRDNNSDQAYYVLIHDMNGQPLPGARKAAGTAFNSYGGIWGLKRNTDAGRSLTQEDFTVNPSLREKNKLEYISFLSQSKDDKDKELLKTELNKFITQPATTESDLAAAKFYYERTLKDKAKADEIDQQIKSKYPTGNWQKTERLNAFFNEKDVSKKEEIYTKYLHDFPPKTADEENTLSSLASNLASGYGTAGNYEKMKQYAANVKSKSSLASIYNTVAWKLSGESVNAKPIDAERGKDLSRQSLELIKAEMNSTQNKPSYYTDKQWKEQLRGSYYSFADTYALLLYHAGNYKEAYQLEKEALDGTKRKNPTINEAYAVYTEKTKGANAAIKELEDFIKEGSSSPAMKEQLKTLYLKNNNASSWDNYYTSLEHTASQKKIEEIAKNMINESAPTFNLKDLNGNTVSLASLKGKTVVVDFWATWCGPCKASFPGMKKAVEKYKNDPDVKFVFVDTWETGEKDKVKKDVEDFIGQNNYPFHVLMDYDNKIVENYKVDGIPTKFIVDKNGQVRFKAIGFSGSPDTLVEEIDAMIEMAKKDAATAKKG